MKNAKALADALANRLDSIVPEGISVTAHDGSIGPVIDGEACGGTDFNGWVEEGVSFDLTDGDAVLAALQAVQDGVARGRKSPWPGEGPELPDPGVKVSEHRLLLWYGDEAEPVLQLDSIEIQDM
jgi:uncharacterized protein YidB (DUF937 family)